jgi:ADP-ribosylglycohydrolase
MLGAIIGDIVGSIYEFNNRRIGGDSDTVAAIAGGVAEALFGIPDELSQEGLSRLPEDMKGVRGGPNRLDSSEGFLRCNPCGL